MSPESIKIVLICSAILILFLFMDGLVLLGGLVILLAALFTSSGQVFFQSLGTLEPRSFREFFIVVFGAFLIIIPMNYLIMFLVKSTTPDEITQDISQSGLMSFLLLLVPVLFAAILEEIIFRGFILTRLSSVFGTSNGALLITVGISSVMFGLGHYYQTGIQSALIVGGFSVVVGVIFVKTGFNLGYAIAIHLLNNLSFVIAHRLWGS